jgi:hypothetical protein
MGFDEMECVEWSTAKWCHSPGRWALCCLGFRKGNRATHIDVVTEGSEVLFYPRSI